MATLKADLDAQLLMKMKRKEQREAAERETDLQDLMYRQVYTGFGRPGCGAPLRNSQGGVLANLGDVFNGDEQVQAVPLSPPRNAKFQVPAQYLVPAPKRAVAKSRLGASLYVYFCAQLWPPGRSLLHSVVLRVKQAMGAPLELNFARVNFW